MSPPVNLTQLATFVRLVEERNFSKTAAALNLTQPAVTQQIRALERDLGVTLVEIIARRAEITEIGVIVAEHGERLLNAASALRRDVRDLVEARRGVLHLGATLTIGSYVLPDLLARFARRFPGIRVEATVGNTAAILPMVVDGRLGLALVEGDVTREDLEVWPFADDEVILIVAPSHALAERRGVEPAELAREPFVSREQGSGTRVLVERGLRAVGIEPRTVLALPTGAGIVRAVQCGLGVAMVPRIVAADALERREVVHVAIRGVDLRRTFRLVRRRLRTPAPAALRFAEMLRGEAVAGAERAGAS